ncbi:V-type ATP synthase subunit D [Croceimicrobium sp.]|uniref:V-type ATP synthase subunit D n=1 Tax=Croceimicrobium sp. TaxID=2828340 RepID=UPI003BA8F43D
MNRAISYNKSTIQEFRKQLQVRRKALPVLMRKETALRQVIADRKPALKQLQKEYQAEWKRLQGYENIWNDLPSVLRVKSIQTEEHNIAGTRIKRLVKVEYEAMQLNPLYEPAWMPAALEALQNLIELKLQLQYRQKELDTLEQARKKTTQKVNLYEKVQIPEYEEGIRKVKRFLEDKENIATAAKKIAKNRKMSRDES